MLLALVLGSPALAGATKPLVNQWLKKAGRAPRGSVVKVPLDYVLSYAGNRLTAALPSWDGMMKLTYLLAPGVSHEDQQIRLAKRRLWSQYPELKVFQGVTRKGLNQLLARDYPDRNGVVVSIVAPKANTPAEKLDRLKARQLDFEPILATGR